MKSALAPTLNFGGVWMTAIVQLIATPQALSAMCGPHCACAVCTTPAHHHNHYHVYLNDVRTKTNALTGRITYIIVRQLH